MNYSNLNTNYDHNDHNIICIHSITLYGYLTHKSYLHIINYIIKCCNNKHN